MKTEKLYMIPTPIFNDLFNKYRLAFGVDETDYDFDLLIKILSKSVKRKSYYPKTKKWQKHFEWLIDNNVINKRVTYTPVRQPMDEDDIMMFMNLTRIWI